ncbi:MAG: hypothetical protein IJX44_05270 [Bacteroidaceae bacterium]|nr:hypothetical protein [Bacteroidaceae bacterium]
MNKRNEIEKIVSSLEYFCNNSYLLVSKFRENIAKSDDDEEFAIAQCILQIAVCRIQSLLKLSSGICIVPNRKEISLLEPTSMVAILRSLYELVFIFRNIYIMTDNAYERRILLNIWQIRGYNNRQSQKAIPKKEEFRSEYSKKQEEDKLHIEELKKAIEQNLTTLNITNGAKSQIRKIMNSGSSAINGYKFEKTNEVISSFSKISLTDSPEYLYENHELDIIYPLLSMYTHPSYLSVLQFGQMFNNNYNEDLLMTILKSACLLNVRIIHDFCQFIPVCQEYYKDIGTNDIVELLKIIGI